MDLLGQQKRRRIVKFLLSINDDLGLSTCAKAVRLASEYGSFEEDAPGGVWFKLNSDASGKDASQALNGIGFKILGGEA
jgi:hypothetical protein